MWTYKQSEKNVLQFDLTNKNPKDEKKEAHRSVAKINRQWKNYFLIGSIYLNGLFWGTIFCTFFESQTLDFVNRIVRIKQSHSLDDMLIYTFKNAYISNVAQLTLIIALGLCLFGKYVIPLFIFLKGIGTGCISTELLIQNTGKLIALQYVGGIWLPEFLMMLLCVVLSEKALRFSDCLKVNKSCVKWSESNKILKQLKMQYIFACLSALIPALLAACISTMLH